jgi:rubrerythrin
VESDEVGVRRERTEGGDPVCRLSDVCPECGFLADGPPPDVCPRCGTALGDSARD